MAILIFLKRRPTIHLMLVLLAFLSAGGASLPGKTAISKEYQIKAAFLFNFTQFVKWPSAAFTHDKQPFLIGVLGEDPFDGFLDDTVRGEKVGGHPVEVQRYNAVEDIKKCHLLFISRSESKRMEKILAGVKGQNVLTVGDFEGFIKSGGVICFLTEKNKIRFRVNLEAAKSVNLDISSKLLRLAEIAGPGKD